MLLMSLGQVILLVGLRDDIWKIIYIFIFYFVSSDWIKGLSDQAKDHFLRGLAIGVELDESWIVCSAAAYIWNYTNHILTQGRHREIVPQLTTVLQGLKKVGHAG